MLNSCVVTTRLPQSDFFVDETHFHLSDVKGARREYLPHPRHISFAKLFFKLTTRLISTMFVSCMQYYSGPHCSRAHTASVEGNDFTAEKKSRNTTPCKGEADRLHTSVLACLLGEIYYRPQCCRRNIY